jgi:exopolyphosphatase/guanosine-5'-triphosphate,3'-diphosphate pyrophosphatase
VRVAALDLGSNSFHLLVADVDADGHLRPVTGEKEMLRLGDAVSRTGRIGPVLCDRAVETVRHFRSIAGGLGAQEILAKATSAVRTAADGSDLVDRIESETGLHVDVISGYEEARLIFEAIRAAVVIDPGPALCLDLGGGSLEVMVGDAAGLRWATSVALGVARLTAEHVHSDPLDKAERKALEKHVRAVLDPIAATVRRYEPRLAIGSSGTLSDLAAVAAAVDTGEEITARNGLVVGAAALRRAAKMLVASTAADRRRLANLDPRRVDLAPAGAVVLDVAVEAFGVEALTISDWALREGIVLDALETHPGDFLEEPRALRRAAVAALARRCASDVHHTDQVKRLALSLFDQTRELHGLDGADRELLEYAAALHDIGQHVSRRAHHKHAAYLVEHAELRGFAPAEVALLAALLRHHRHGSPKVAEPYLAGLDDDQRRRVVALAALLRVADGLDRGRRSPVDEIKVQVSGDLVIVRVSAHDDVELELWGARRRRGLFEEVFGREIEFTAAGSPTRNPGGD